MANKEYTIQINANVASAKAQISELKTMVEQLTKQKFELSLGADVANLTKVINNLDKMLDSLGNGKSDFSQFKNLGTTMTSIMSDLKDLNSALSKINSNGSIGTGLASSFDKINASLIPVISNLERVVTLQESLSNKPTKQSRQKSKGYSNDTMDADELEQKLTDRDYQKKYKKLALAKYKLNSLDIAEATGKSSNDKSEYNSIKNTIEQLETELKMAEDAGVISDKIYEAKKKYIANLEKSNADAYYTATGRYSTKQQEKAQSETNAQYIDGMKKLISLEKEKSQIEAKTASNNGKVSSGDESRLNYLNQQIVAQEKLLSSTKATNDVIEQQASLRQQAKDENSSKYNQSVQNANEATYRKQQEEYTKQQEKAQKAVDAVNTSLSKINLPDSISSDVTELTNKIKTLGDEFVSSSKQMSGDDFNNALKEYKTNVSEITDQLKNYQKLARKGNILDEDALQSFGLSSTDNNIADIQTKIRQSLESTGKEIMNFSSTTDMSTGFEQFTYKIKDAEGQVQSLAFTYDSATNKIAQKTSTLSQQGSKVEQFFGSVKNKISEMSTYWMAQLFDPYKIVNSVQNMIDSIIALDDAMIDLKKTANMSDSELDTFYSNASANAKKMGVTTSEWIQQAADMSRAGYQTYDEATIMAQNSSRFAAIANDIDTDEATTGLISIMKAFDIKSDEVESKISDKVNEIGNTFSVTNGEILTGLEKSSASMAVAGNSLDQTIALFTAGQEIVQNADTVGQSLKTISMRIRGYDEETEELSDDLKTITGDIADLTKTADNPTGVSLFTDDTKETYRSTYDILKDISEIYDQLSDKNRAQLLEKLFGKTRANRLCPDVQKCAYK